jgi:threonine aldolase
MMKAIDLRSDTVTRPTAAMRQAMFEAEVGDDVYREDPTVNRLEDLAARLAGKEAAIFVPTGTMGNQIALCTHGRPGQELIVESRSHVMLYEMGGPSVNAGLLTRTIAGSDGILRWQQIQPLVRPPGDHYRGTGLIVVENTHNMAGGRVYPPEILAEIYREAHAAGIPVHMDGARIFNAAAYLGRPVEELAASADSVMYCLSKGLGAPVGSLLAGTRPFIEQARLARKGFGGGMRQAGVLAAAGIVALEQSPAGLPNDHANARYLADSLSRMPGVAIDSAGVETNILVFDISRTGLHTREFSGRLREKGVLANGLDAVRMRMVTHFDVSRKDCEQAVGAMEEILRKAAA